MQSRYDSCLLTIKRQWQQCVDTRHSSGGTTDEQYQLLTLDDLRGFPLWLRGDDVMNYTEPCMRYCSSQGMPLTLTAETICIPSLRRSLAKHSIFKMIKLRTGKIDYNVHEQFQSAEYSALFRSRSNLQTRMNYGVNVLLYKQQNMINLLKDDFLHCSIFYYYKVHIPSMSLY